MTTGPEGRASAVLALAARMRQQLARDDGGEPFAEPDVGQHLLGGLGRGLLEHLLPVRFADLRETGLERAERLIEQPLAELRRFLELHRLQEMADVRARLAGDDVIEPGRVGLRVRRGDDLDAVAVLQLGAQRHQLVVDLRRDAAVADVGMHRIGEVDAVAPRGSAMILPLGVNT